MVVDLVVDVFVYDVDCGADVAGKYIVGLVSGCVANN